ncbi:HalOD1 output domain-containing protein [Halobaculum rubrum]|uniref:HalOD1 output domain-containing protein n=1 Tax=Halobaculum rubrum TaxID=2872158 RepID=UPI001CA3FDD3|nr:HalOD1 output domain-containing protein [Halobaculum rubrum]QZX99163.1 hypothetical protein K6T25_12995 [Halobaculum rubrum]
MDDSDASPERDPQVHWRGRDWTKTAHRQFDPAAGGDLTSAIVRALADAKRVSPHELTGPTLYDCVDMDAVTQFVAAGRSPTAPKPDFVRFEYDESLVEVRTDGRISVFASVADAV